MTTDDLQQRVTRYSIDVFVTLIIIALFGYMSLRFLSPFISILIWAVIMAVALLPLFEKAKRSLGGGGRAGTLFALVGLVVLLAPTYLVVDSIIGTIGDLAGDLRSGEFKVSPPDPSVKDWPLIGGRAFDFWTAASENLTETARTFAPQLEELGLKLLGVGAGLLGGVLQFAVSIIFAAILLGYAESLDELSTKVASRISSGRGRAFVEMAGATVRSVSRGVLGVALIQGGLAAVGMVVAGLPFAGVWAALVLIGCIVQAPPLIIIPSVIYAWSVESSTVALIFTVYMIPVMFLDNVLKPLLLARGLETPMIVILIGVIGGTLTSGLLGLFIGPVVLALFHKMVVVWMTGLDDAPAVATEGATGEASDGASDSAPDKAT